MGACNEGEGSDSAPSEDNLEQAEMELLIPNTDDGTEKKFKIIRIKKERLP